MNVLLFLTDGGTPWYERCCQLFVKRFRRNGSLLVSAQADNADGCH